MLGSGPSQRVGLHGTRHASGHTSTPRIRGLSVRRVQDRAVTVNHMIQQIYVKSRHGLAISRRPMENISISQVWVVCLSRFAL